MNTNYNATSTASAVSLSAVMLRAWDIRRAAAADIAAEIVGDFSAAVDRYDIPPAVCAAFNDAFRAGGISAAAGIARRYAVALVDMGACLRMAWAETGATSSAARAVDAIRREWDELTDSEQIALVRRQVQRAAKDVIGYSEGGTDSNPAYSAYWEKPAFCALTADLGDYVNETFARVLSNWERQARHNAQRAANGCKPRTLKSYVKACAKQAVMSIYRAEVKHGRAARDYIDADGERQSIVETLCPAGDDTAREVVFAYALEQFRATRDALDNAIIDGLCANRTTREIGDACGMSHVAIVKRIKKIRAAMVAAGIAPAAWADEQ